LHSNTASAATGKKIFSQGSSVVYDVSVCMYEETAL